MESYEENRVKWLIDKPGGLFLTRRSGTLRRAGGTYPTTAVSTGCLLIAPSDWGNFNSVMSGVTDFRVQVMRWTTTNVPLLGVNGVVPNISIQQKILKK